MEIDREADRRREPLAEVPGVPGGEGKLSIKIAVKRTVWPMCGMEFLDDLIHYVHVTCAWRHAVFAIEQEDAETPPTLDVTKNAEYVYLRFVVPTLRGLNQEQIENVCKDVVWFLRGSLVRYAERCIGDAHYRIAQRFRDAVIVCDD